jgi:preprotein translocase subunit SecG
MGWLLFLLEFVLVASALILIVLVLLQKGKGGGLAGALGGMGGQSAFGTKAGDLFTRITMVVAGVWIILCLIACLGAKHLAGGGDQLNVTQTPMPGQQAPAPSDQPAGSATKPDAGGAAKPESNSKSAAPATPPKSGSVPEPSSKPSENPAK